jgi:hypothetical protein
MSPIGTKRTCGNDRLFVRFWGEADVYGPLALRASVANDPKRSLARQVCCAAQHNFRGSTGTHGITLLNRRFQRVFT